VIRIEINHTVGDDLGTVLTGRRRITIIKDGRVHNAREYHKRDRTEESVIRELLEDSKLIEIVDINY